MPKVLFVRPGGDAVELALSSWGALVLAAAGRAAAVSTTDLRAAAVTKKAVEQALSHADAAWFFLHGKNDRLGDPTAVVDSANVAKGSGAVIVAFACESGKNLGRDAINTSNGVRAFLGFDDILAVYHAQPSLLGRVVENALRPFIVSGGDIDSVRSALEAGLQQVEHTYLHGSGRSHPDAGLIWLAAHVNWRGLVLHGDASATVP